MKLEETWCIENIDKQLIQFRGFPSIQKLEVSNRGGTVCRVSREGNGSLNSDKTSGKRKKGNMKKCTDLLQKLCAFLLKNSVSSSSFGYLPPETKKV